jgi:hypothetical protein
MITAMIIEISRMKASPSGFISAAFAGLKYPKTIAIAIAMST